MGNAYDKTRLRQGNYDVTLGSYTFGVVDDVDPSGLKIKWKPITIGSLGEVIIGYRCIGLEGVITAQLREIDVVTCQKMMPWYSSGSIPLMPSAWHKDLYDYAQQLVLHPTDVTGTAQDITLLKAVPIFSPLKRNGKDDEFITATFMPLPDLSQLINQSSPLLAYGYVGAAP